MCGDMDSVSTTSSSEPKATARKVVKASKLSDDFQALVSAQNRTTHAVRSLATFLFISICSTVIGYGLVGASQGETNSCALRGEYCDGSGFLIVGWLVIVVGFFLALGVGISELNKSRIN